MSGTVKHLLNGMTHSQYQIMFMKSLSLEMLINVHKNCKMGSRLSSMSTTLFRWRWWTGNILAVFTSGYSYPCFPLMHALNRSGTPFRLGLIKRTSFTGSRARRQPSTGWRGLHGASRLWPVPSSMLQAIPRLHQKGIPDAPKPQGPVPLDSHSTPLTTRPSVNTVSHYQLSSNYSISSQITGKFS